MFTPVTVDRLYAGSVFKLIGIGLTCSIVPLSVLMGVFALIGALPLTWNAKQIVGVWGLALFPLFGVLLTLALTFAVGIPCVIGLWLYSRMRPIILWGKNVQHDPDAIEEASTFERRGDSVRPSAGDSARSAIPNLPRRVSR